MLESLDEERSYLQKVFCYTIGKSVFKIGRDYLPYYENINVTFDDVKGCDEAKEELRDVVEFLRNPAKYTELGAKLPSGILLEGPPGTGKTLLARCVAGEANVRFFYTCGSEFDELLVGEGARRIRSVFKAARENAPSVIFIDEIDAVGAKRISTNVQPYANQTINQLLSEMDGFTKNDSVIVIGATNRASELDQALLRPGRFDLKVSLQQPDIKGRREILQLFLNKTKTKDVDIDLIARSTIGLAGADLENIVNQAKIRASSLHCPYVTTEHLEYALEKLTLGPERKSLVKDKEQNLMTAYHESGHAVVAHFTKDSDLPVKLTIIPRSKTLGHTRVQPSKDQALYTKSEILAKIDVQMGGRAAEELMFGPDKVTTGCENDIRNATALATQMVRSWSMSDVGVRTFDNFRGSPLDSSELGQATTDNIDMEIKRILQNSYERAKKLLITHAKEHKRLAETLLQKETLGLKEIQEILGAAEMRETN